MGVPLVFTHLGLVNLENFDPWVYLGDYLPQPLASHNIYKLDLVLSHHKINRWV